MFTYESMQSIIPNAIMRKAYWNGDLLNYLIKPTTGYVLHDSNYDAPIIDENTYEETGVVLGYRTTEGSVASWYDFTPFEMQDEAGNTVLAYGERQFFCKPIDEVSADQTLGVTRPQSEIM